MKWWEWPILALIYIVFWPAVLLWPLFFKKGQHVGAAGLPIAIMMTMAGWTFLAACIGAAMLATVRP